jgi:uncharacterized membrane protein YdbT with pleckstrin-like domain
MKQKISRQIIVKWINRICFAIIVLFLFNNFFTVIPAKHYTNSLATLILAICLIAGIISEIIMRKSKNY